MSFFIPKWVYHGLGEDAPSSFEDWNDYVYNVDEYYDLRIAGRVSFETEPDPFDGSIRGMKDWAQIFETLDVEVEIESIEITDEDACTALRS